MKWFVPVFSVVIFACTGCSPERSHAVNEAEANSGQGDFRKMIERTRARQSAQNTLEEMQAAVQKFQSELGRLPTNIAELVVRKYVKAIPQLPADQHFEYDTALGVLSIKTDQRPDMLAPKIPPLVPPELTNRPALSR